MADGTHIEWTDATWNPITGCSVVSPGCTNCYAMKLAGTRLKHHWSRKDLTVDTKAGPVWTGRLNFNLEWLDQPLRWTKPRMIFVCAHGDLFHESVPDEWIDRVFAVMALCPQHVFQVLTKRADRMRAYMRAFVAGGRAVVFAGKGLAPPGRLAGILAEIGNAYPACSPLGPLPNVWLGVSVEDQKRANERIPDLLATPAAVRWLSMEPLLGPVDLEAAWHGENALDSECWGECNWCRLGDEYPPLHNCQKHRQSRAESDKGRSGLDWIVLGGESGPGARPMHPDWARTVRDQCAAAGVPFFFKQWGDWHPMGQMLPCGAINAMTKGERPGLWDADTMSVRIGKKAAGALLAGQSYRAMPALSEATQ